MTPSGRSNHRGAPRAWSTGKPHRHHRCALRPGLKYKVHEVSLRPTDMHDRSPLNDNLVPERLWEVDESDELSEGQWREVAAAITAAIKMVSIPTKMNPAWRPASPNCVQTVHTCSPGLRVTQSSSMALARSRRYSMQCSASPGSRDVPTAPLASNPTIDGWICGRCSSPWSTFPSVTPSLP